MKVLTSRSILILPFSRFQQDHTCPSSTVPEASTKFTPTHTHVQMSWWELQGFTSISNSVSFLIVGLLVDLWSTSAFISLLYSMRMEWINEVLCVVSDCISVKLCVQACVIGESPEEGGTCVVGHNAGVYVTAPVWRLPLSAPSFTLFYPLSHPLSLFCFNFFFLVTVTSHIVKKKVDRKSSPAGGPNRGKNIILNLN